MKTLRINEKDNVLLCLEKTDMVPAGHKIAAKDIKSGELVIKYGEVIGRATCDIKAGEHVHTHNMKTALGEGGKAYSYSGKPEINENAYGEGRAEFYGYPRSWGNAGVRNDIYIIPTVGCVNGVCKRLEALCQKLVTGSVDSIISLPHQFGCSQIGEDGENIKRFLCAIALNPNAAAVLFVGLGCENNGIEGMKEYIEPFGRDNIAFIKSAEAEDEIEIGYEIIKGFVEKIKDQKRVSVDLRELTVGLKCGGSDGFSGITANPLVGKISDRLVSLGASAILTEVPEMFGAETVLMRRCADESIFVKYRDMILNFMNYYESLGFPIYENPSPGNKEGGITTLEEKSLGCIEKAGSTKINDVIGYADRVKSLGVSVLDGPGNDLIAASALAAAGCQIVLFTTGRGTPFSTCVPTMKISTNKSLAERKRAWIDFDASDMNEEGLFDLLLRTANGEYICKSEDIKEIAFFKKGVTL